jgi:hypothetical protein
MKLRRVRLSEMRVAENVTALNDMFMDCAEASPSDWFPCFLDKLNKDKAFAFQIGARGARLAPFRQCVERAVGTPPTAVVSELPDIHACFSPHRAYVDAASCVSVTREGRRERGGER